MKIEPKPQQLDRKLLYFPIVHTPADMGKLGDAVKSLYLRKMGRTAWNRKIDLVNKFWDQVAEIISNVQIEETTTRVYQDGLPVTNNGKEFEIIKKLADSGSRNHLLVVGLVERGAILMGTESIDLLMAEYDITKKHLENQSSGKPGMGKKIRESEDDILKKRDQFIASRINQTLGEGELGIIFLGMLHDIKPWLSEDIEVVFPVLIEAGRRPS
jgi:hypothetical protein